MVLKRFTLVVSIIAFVYFAYLFLMFFTETEFPTFAGAIHELIMIPLMLAIPVFFIISLVAVIREKFKARTTSFYSLLLLAAALAMLVLLIMGYIETEP